MPGRITFFQRSTLEKRNSVATSFRSVGIAIAPAITLNRMYHCVAEQHQRDGAQAHAAAQSHQRKQDHREQRRQPAQRARICASRLRHRTHLPVAVAERSITQRRPGSSKQPPADSGEIHPQKRRYRPRQQMNIFRPRYRPHQPDGTFRSKQHDGCTGGQQHPRQYGASTAVLRYRMGRLSRQTLLPPLRQLDVDLLVQRLRRTPSDRGHHIRVRQQVQNRRAHMLRAFQPART